MIAKGTDELDKFYLGNTEASKIYKGTDVIWPTGTPLITYLYDTFTGVDGTNLTAHTMNIGSGWTSQVDGLCGVNSIMFIQSNKAKNLSGLLQFYTGNAGVTDYVVSLDLSVINANTYLGGILFRFSTCGNYWALVIERDGGTPYMAIIESNGGTRTYRSQVDVPAATNSTLNLKLTLSGNSIVALAGTGETCNYSSSLFASSTLVGLVGYDGGGTYTPAIPMDNFIVTNQ